MNADGLFVWTEKMRITEGTAIMLVGHIVGTVLLWLGTEWYIKNGK